MVFLCHLCPDVLCDAAAQTFQGHMLKDKFCMVTETCHAAEL